MTEKDLQNFRVGNYVSYKKAGYPTDFWRLDKIQETKNDPLYHLSHASGTVVCREMDIREIVLEPVHLEKLGFHLSPVTGIYSLVQIHISYHTTTTKNDEGGLSLTLPVMRIFKPFTPVPQNKNQLLQDEILANTIMIPYIHSFQNYCEEMGMKINFGLLAE